MKNPINDLSICPRILFIAISAFHRTQPTKKTETFRLKLLSTKPTDTSDSNLSHLSGGAVRCGAPVSSANQRQNHPKPKRAHHEPVSGSTSSLCTPTKTNQTNTHEKKTARTHREPHLATTTTSTSPASQSPRRPTDRPTNARRFNAKHKMCFVRCDGAAVARLCCEESPRSASTHSVD